MTEGQFQCKSMNNSTEPPTLSKRDVSVAERSKVSLWRVVEVGGRRRERELNWEDRSIKAILGSRDSWDVGEYGTAIRSFDHRIAFALFDHVKEAPKAVPGPSLIGSLWMHSDMLPLAILPLTTIHFSE